MRNMGYLTTKADLISIIRRFDLNGDAKISLDEFKDGLKSSLVAKTA